MNLIRKAVLAFGVFSALTFAVPSQAASRLRRDPAAQAALTTIAQMQTTLTAMQQLIDGIQARHAAAGTPAPAGQ